MKVGGTRDGSIFSTQHHAAAAVAEAGTSSVFAWKGKTMRAMQESTCCSDVE